MFSQPMQSYMQRTVAQFLTDTCLIQVETNGQDEFGAPSPSLTTVSTNVPCRLIRLGQQRSGSVMTAADEQTMRHEYRLIVAVGTVLAIDQRITVGGLLYNVVRVEAALTQQVFLSAILYRRE